MFVPPDAGNATGAPRHRRATPVGIRHAGSDLWLRQRRSWHHPAAARIGWRRLRRGTGERPHVGAFRRDGGYGIRPPSPKVHVQRAAGIPRLRVRRDSHGMGGLGRERPAAFALSDQESTRMAGIDETRPFIPVNIAILTVSDTRTLANDTSGDALAERIAKAGHRVAERAIEKDDAGAIERHLRAWIADGEIDVVITTGGTGITGRDVTPEAFDHVLEKRIEGFGELFRMLSYQKIGTSTMQSRALGGVAGGTYLFALPGSTGAVKDAWDDILVFQLDNRFRPCNLVELMPRLQEHLRTAAA